MSPSLRMSLLHTLCAGNALTAIFAPAPLYSRG